MQLSKSLGQSVILETFFLGVSGRLRIKPYDDFRDKMKAYDDLFDKIWWDLIGCDLIWIRFDLMWFDLDKIW